MRRSRIFCSFAALFLTVGEPALGASNQDPSWPCIQRKVPELSLAQIWTGPDLVGSSKDGSKDPEVSALVVELAARKTPISEAQKKICEFAASLPAGELTEQLTGLFLGLFDHMNAERSQVIAGIGRYAQRQSELAERIRNEASYVDKLRANADADAVEIAQRMDRLTLETRIFDESVQSLTYVCEVPTLIEQRLFALARTIVGALAKE